MGQRLRIAGVAALALVVGACASKAPPAATATITTTTVSPALTSAAYFAAASSSALFAVKSAELAMERSSDPEVLALARMRKQNGEGIAGQLSFAGRRLDMLPSAQLAPGDQARLDALAASTNFDADFMATQDVAVDETLRLHRSFATSGGSATLRPVAELGADLTAREDAALED